MRKQDFIGIGIVTLTLVVMCMLAGAFAPATAQTCDLPLFIKQGAIDANVVFLFDSSGSMNEAIQSDDYNPNTSYSGDFRRSRSYNVATTGTYSPRSFSYRWPTTPTATLVQSDQGEDGVYDGNYLNWIFYHATAAQRAAIPQYTRVQMAKAALYAIVDAADTRIRFGVYRFNGVQVAPLGTDRGTLKSMVQAIHATGYTPLGETLLSIRNYYRNDPDAIQYACQRNFVVIVTDGLPTSDNPPVTDKNQDGYKVDDVATLLRNDLRSDMDGTQYANTYTVGMNIDAPVLATTAANGDGAYFTANNAAQLASSLQKVLRDIVNRISAGSAVAVVSTEGQASDFLYRGKFLPSDWSGYLEAFELPYETGEAPVWEADSLLQNRSTDTRTIFTSVAGNPVDFVTGQSAALRVPLGAATDAEAQNIITWTRGEDVAGYRDRGGHILGDIVESSPVPVGGPTGFYLYQDYLSFRAANANRDRVIYVGGNDAMMHCFLAETGDELWAYIPNNQLDKLKELTDPDYCHEFSVNLTPRVTDCFIQNQWRTVLIGGEKQGGGAYFAIDVTDPHNPSLLWENDVPGVVQSWAQPAVVHMKETDQFVAFVGSGLDKNGYARLLGFNMEDGSVLYQDDLSHVNSDYNMATACTAIDRNLDDYDDVMYLSDLTGHLWRVDLTGNTPTRTLLFDTGGQPIQAQPICTLDYNGYVYIYFGTGRYVETDDFLDASQQTYYCIIDKNDGAEVTKNELVDQSTTINQVGASKGWYVDLDLAPGERVTEPNALVAGIVYFTTYAPSSEPCTSGGKSWLYAVQFRNGAAYDGDTDSGNDTADGRATEIGDGISTKPVIDIMNEKVLVQGSDTRIHVEDTLGEIKQLIVRAWKQQY